MTEWVEENLENKYYDWPVFKRILGYLRPYRSLVIVSLLLLLAVSMLSLAGPLLTKIAIDDYIRLQQLRWVGSNCTHLYCGAGWRICLPVSAVHDHAVYWPESDVRPANPGICAPAQDVLSIF